MSDPGLFKQIVDYVDHLHRDIGQMVLVIEQSMSEYGYESPMGGRASREISSHYARPDGWRIPYVYRLYIPVDRDRTTSSVFFLVLLESDSAFDFPPVICARVTHPPFNRDEVSSHVLWGIYIRSLARRNANWSRFHEANGWIVAEDPKHDTLVGSVQGYILNLFDMVDRQRVIDNIVRPLTNTEHNLDEMLTVNKYAFPDYMAANDLE